MAESPKHTDAINKTPHDPPLEQALTHHQHHNLEKSGNTIENMIINTFQSQTASTYIINKTICRMHNRVYSKAIDNKLTDYSISDTFNHIFDTVTNAFKHHEETEDSLFSTEPKYRNRTGRHIWTESEEPPPSKFDVCVRGKIEVIIKQEVTKIVQSEEEIGIDYLAQTLPKSGTKSVNTNIRKKQNLVKAHKEKIKNYDPVCISLEDDEDCDPDKDIAILRKKQEEKDIVADLAAKKEKQRQQMRKLLEEEMRRNWSQMKTNQTTYAYDGKIMAIKPVEGHKLPEVNKRCTYSFPKEAKNMSRAGLGLGITKSNFNKTTSSRFTDVKTPAKEKTFVKNIVRGAGSNFDDIVPSFMGVTIKETGRLKRGDLSFGEMFRSPTNMYKTSKWEYEQKVAEMNDLFLETATSRLHTEPHTNREGFKPKEYLERYPIPETELKESEKSYEPSEGDYIRRPMTQKTISTKENYNVQDLIMNPAAYRKGKMQDIQEYPTSFVPLPKSTRDIRSLRKAAPGSKSEKLLPAPRGPTDAELKSLQMENPIDVFNRTLLRDEYWGSQASTGNKNERILDAKFMKPGLKNYLQSVPNLKKLPRERMFIEKTRNKFRLPPPKLGRSYGHGIV